MGKNTHRYDFYLDKFSGRVGIASALSHAHPKCYPERYVSLGRHHSDKIIFSRQIRNKYLVVIAGRTDKLVTVKVLKKEREMIAKMHKMGSNMIKPKYWYLDLKTNKIDWDKSYFKGKALNIGRYGRSGGLDPIFVIKEYRDGNIVILVNGREKVIELSPEQLAQIAIYLLTDNYAA